VTEKLPQKTNNLETTEKRPSIEGSPVVENMPVRSAGVLVKVTFPRPESVAKIFMLVQEPTSEQGIKNVEKLAEEHPENRKMYEEMTEAMNGALIFRNPEEAQKWFDIFSHTCSPAECREIADFLEVENKEN